MANERVLIVDDEQEIVRLCAVILAGEGYVTEGVSSGWEALLRLEAEAFDLLIVDIKMPEMDGLELLRRARDLEPNLTTIVITGYATMDRAIEALNSGARRFVLKPFGVEELLSAVEDAMAQKRREEEVLRLRAQLPILEIGQMLMREGDVESLSRRLLDVVVRQTEADQAVLMLLDERAGELHVVAVCGLPDGIARQQRVPAAQSMIGELLEAQEPLVREVLADSPLESGVAAMWASTEPGSLVLTPLRTGQKAVGILGLGYRADAYHRGSNRRPPLSPSALNLLSIMAGQIAIALENMRMYELEQQRTEALAHALEQQRELDRLKGEFMRNVSHELRTPLSMILGYSELLTSGVLGEMRAEQIGALEIIVQRAFALRDLVDNITAILENESREPQAEPVPLAEIIEEALADFQVLADQASLTLKGEINVRELSVLGDPSHLRRMVDNLISNALKFTPAGGTVAVCLDSVDGQAVLRVSDTGIGISETHVGRIFERFYQVDGTIRRQFGGSGLGLALVKEIVEGHQGTVQVESRPGEGSTFEVRLPVMD